MTKQEILDAFSDIDFVYNNSSKHETLSRMLDELLKEQKEKTGSWIILDNCSNNGIYCSECRNKIFNYTTKPTKKRSQYCPNCGSRNEQFFRDGMVVFR